MKHVITLAVNGDGVPAIYVDGTHWDYLDADSVYSLHSEYPRPKLAAFKVVMAHHKPGEWPERESQLFLAGPPLESITEAAS